MVTRAQERMVENRLLELGIRGKEGKYTYKGRTFSTAREAYNFAMAETRNANLTAGLTGRGVSTTAANVGSSSIHTVGSTPITNVAGLLENNARVRTVNAFNINDKYFLLEDFKTIGCYDKLDKADWVKHIRKLNESGVNIIQGEPVYNAPSSSSIYPHKDGDIYARMLEEQKGSKKPCVKPKVTVNSAPIDPNKLPVPASHYSANGGLPAPTQGPRQTPTPGPSPVGKNIPWKKIGKWGAIIAGVAALGLGIAALVKGCSGNKNTAPIADTPQPTPVKPEEPATPVVPTPPEKQEETPAVPTEPENITSNAVKGDNYWKYAEMELIAEHQGETGYKPSNAEILERMHEIMDRTNVGMAKDGIHPNPMLKVDDEVKLNEKAAKLRNEAIKQLKEEHKDQKDYKPTYSEVNKKFQELVEAQKESKAA